MKRISILALLLITCVFASLSFVACGKGSGGNKHKHSFTVEAATDEYLCSEATCTQKATYYYSCKCGAKGTETFEYGNPKGHSFTNYKPNDDATCSSDGTKTAHCDRCDAIDVIADVGSKLQHTYDAKWTSDDEYHWHKATCEHTAEVSGKAKHTAGEWIIDEAATYEKAGKRHKECEVCEKLLETEVIPQLEKDEIIFKTITFGEDKKANFKISNGQTTFNVKDEISASGKSQFIVSKNADGSNPITGETVALECGDNVIYVIETVDGTTVNVYVITIYRRFVYTITFNTNGGNNVANQQVEEDSLVILPPSPTKAGYTFDGWDYDFTKPVDGAVTINAKWTANTDTKYKVEYYLQNLDNDDYTLEETANLTGTTDTTANAEQKTFEHFVIDIEISIVSGNIEGDGTLVLKIYYTRKTYEILIENDETSGTVTDISGTYKYGEKLTVKVESTNRGYIFDGWYNGETLLSAEEEYIFIIKKTVTITAKWGKESSQGLSYSLSFDKKSYAVSGIGSCTDTELIIPKTYNDLPVTSIGNYAFNNCSELKSLIIPISVTYIGKYAFQNCSGLTSLIIPDKVKTIGEAAFDNCSGLTSLIIGSNVDTIYSFAFSGCSGLTNLIIPDNVTSIGERAFSGCSGLLTSLIIPDKVRYIGEYAFSGCSGITSVTIGNAVNSIGMRAFYNCSLTSVIWNAESCSRTGTDINNNYFGIFSSSIENLTIGNNVKTIPSYAFSGLSGLTSLIIPDSVTYIGERAFDCRNLTSIVIGKSVTTIGNSAFYNCGGLIVYYKGSAEEWNNITIASDNTNLVDATRYYYSESAPSLNEDGTEYDGNYWLYDTDGVTPVIWKKEN